MYSNLMYRICLLLKYLWKHQSVLHYFIDHPPPEVRHVFLIEGESGPPRDVLGKFAGEHPTVRPVVLLRDVVGDNFLPL